MDQQVQQEERIKFGEEEGRGSGLIPVPQGEEGQCAWLHGIGGRALTGGWPHLIHLPAGLNVLCHL